MDNWDISCYIPRLRPIILHDCQNKGEKDTAVLRFGLEIIQNAQIVTSGEN